MAERKDNITYWLTEQGFEAVQSHNSLGMDLIQKGTGKKVAYLRGEELYRFRGSKNRTKEYIEEVLKRITWLR